MNGVIDRGTERSATAWAGGHGPIDRHSPPPYPRRGAPPLRHGAAGGGRNGGMAWADEALPRSHWNGGSWRSW